MCRGFIPNTVPFMCSHSRLDSVRSAAINSWLQHVTVVNRKRSVATPFHSHSRHHRIRVTRNLTLCAQNSDSAIFGISGKSQKFRSLRFPAPPIRSNQISVLSLFHSVCCSGDTVRRNRLPFRSKSFVNPYYPVTRYALTSPLSASIRRSDHLPSIANSRYIRFEPHFGGLIRLSLHVLRL